MKGKKTLNTLIIAVLIVSMTAVFSNLAYAQYGNLYIDPAAKSYYTQNDLACTTDFNVTLKVTNVTDMAGFGAAIWYNTTLLDAVACNVLVPGATNLAPVDPLNYSWVPINDTLGRVLFGFTVPLPGVTGSFSILSLKFHITLAPPLNSYPYPVNETVGCPLELNMCSIVDKYGAEQIQNYNIIGGSYEYIRPQQVAGAPTAIFTYSPPFPYVGDTVTVDGSGSLTGDSTITIWDWSFTGPATWTSPNGMSTRTFTCDGPVTVTVTLNITNTLGLWDTETHDIPQKLKLGPAIDLYTQTWRQYPEGTVTPFDGKGAFLDADSFAPGENVTLWANVTYNGDIVQNILVGFEVLDPLNRCVTYRVDPTDEIGIAQVWFRIPIPCSPAEQLELFGHWTVIAKCKLQDDIINDTMHFKVGFIIDIIDLVPLQPYLIKGTTTCFNVTLKNIAWVPRNVTVIVVVYDECDVPIGQKILEFEMPAAPAVLCSSVDVTVTLCIDVPKWAYVGIGYVYATAFTDLPQNCGVPYCPEESEVIEIKAS